jgi:peptide/nickel transport system permease protein
MYLAGAILLIYCFLTVLGTLVSDIVLAWLDPRIRVDDA